MGCRETLDFTKHSMAKVSAAAVNAGGHGRGCGAAGIADAMPAGGGQMLRARRRRTAARAREDCRAPVRRLVVRQGSLGLPMALGAAGAGGLPGAGAAARASAAERLRQRRGRGRDTTRRSE